MEKVPRDLSIYAQYVLSVIETVLRSQDISMVEDSIATFETFCTHQDMASLASDQELWTRYQGVVRTYASFADTKSSQAKAASSSPVSIRWRNAGLRAMKGVVGPDATLAADGGDSLKFVLPVILENLYTGEEDLLVLLQLNAQKTEGDIENEMGSGRRDSVVSAQNADAAEIDPTLAPQTTADADRKAEMDVRLLALRCLEQIVVSESTRGQIRIMAMTILRFILGKAPISGSSEEKEAGGTWATSLMELMTKWCPVQVRFIILNSAMEVLLEIKPTEENLVKSSTMAYVIDWLLKSSVNMIGLSVIDVLLGLLQYICSVLSPGTEKARNGASAEKDGPHSNEASLSDQRRELLNLLEQAVGNLGTHIYYGEQITDMIQTILSHVKTSGPDTPATTATTDQPNGKPATPPGEAHVVAFSSSTAKLIALKAVKNILTVAGGKQRTVSAGVESRNQVGIHVWEDTQWLLCDQRDVYYAYCDALLSWLRLETDEEDLKFKEPPKKTTSAPKRELPDIAEKPVQRAASTSVNHRARAVHVAQSNFLRLLHLAVYEHALEQSSDESEMLLLHLLLTNMVERLGVNAVRFGLPMILKLQSDITASDNSHSATAKVNLGSLVFGYFWELTKKFDLDVYRIGGTINSEIDKRKNFGVWLDNVRVPPVDLEGIVPTNNKDVNNHSGLQNPELLRPLCDEVYELVDRIEETYNASTVSPPQSPPSSPERGSGNKRAAIAPQKDRLPPGVKDDMLLQWSKDTCLAAAEKDKAKTLSLSGSKVGTFAMRNHANANGVSHNDSAASTTSPASAQQAGSGSFGAGTAAAGHLDPRRLNVPALAGTSMDSSSRGPAVRMDELRRVLSNNQDTNNRRLGPLRGRLDDTDGAESSSSESMVSGFSASEIDADGVSSRPQSVVETPEDGTETPRASTYVLAGIDGHASPNGVPPVPPIPPTISVPSIPGGFPSDSRTPTPMSERPVTSPAPRKQGPVNVNGNGTAGPHHASRSSTHTLNKRKSRSNTMLVAVTDEDELAEQEHGPSTTTNGGGGHYRHDTHGTLSQFLSSHDHNSEGLNGKVNVSRRTNNGISARKSIHGGIGRPPY